MDKLKQKNDQIIKALKTLKRALERFKLIEQKYSNLEKCANKVPKKVLQCIKEQNE